MKIVIVGAGISGISTYLHLLKHLPNPSAHTLVIYESHKPRSSSPSAQPPADSATFDSLSQSTQLVGGGLGISPNGMRILLTLDKALHDAVAAQGFCVENFIFKGANGWTLGTQKTGDGKVKAIDDKEEFCIASSRHGLWETMFKHAIEVGGSGAIKYRRVVSIVREANEGAGIVVKFEDGGEEMVDLVIGADGVKSVCRTALFGTEEKYAPKYIGQSGVGGFLSLPMSSIVASKAMTFTFGPNGFFGYSSSGPTPPNLMWWSTFETSSVPSIKDMDAAVIKKALVERHKNWKDPILHDIIKNADVESVYPTWTVPELPHWGERGIVLVGDSCHAMDPTTGQGASQGLEDSKTLALLIAECLKRAETEHRGIETEKDAVDLAIKLYHEIRSPRVAEIVERGKKLAGKKANVGPVMEYVTYFFLWLMMAVPSIGKFLLGDVLRSLNTWSAEEEVHKVLQKLEDSS
ncbi:hypothetical protein BCR34DRAFT_586912 [Clohesyomyces aquaticus]|uniref:FAD-binding domain-containing protein n=1 Tax=Clohesyomyces aquaticus TaxID=1231657 RepID=A0A1Y1ZRD9_9PLEO|nr:hypothetical protein BCR34DRAFT_586912 [Clohesyomyces aquaticus]